MNNPAMKVRKYRITCNGHFKGFVFIGDSHQLFPDNKIGTLLHFDLKSTYEDNLEHISKSLINDMFHQKESDSGIIDHLLRLAKIVCDNPKVELEPNIELS